MSNVIANFAATGMLMPAVYFGSPQLDGDILMPNFDLSFYVRLTDVPYNSQTMPQLQVPRIDSATSNVAKSEIDATTEKFYSLATQWKRETGRFSVIARRYENPAYKAILDMRELAIPLILNELKRNPDRWFSALEKLTGENPAKDAVNFYEAVDRWVAWGIASEYIA